MEQVRRFTLLVMIALLALVVAGCAGLGQASDSGPAETPVKVLDATPTPGGAAGSDNVAGTPMTGRDGATQAAPEGKATPAPLDVQGWERHRFYDNWEFAYPAGWQVDRPGEGNVVLSGLLEGSGFLIDIARVFDPSAITPEEWVNGEVTRLNGEGQGRLTISDTEVAGDPAKRLSGLVLADVPGVEAEKYGIRTECPAERVYVWDKGAGVAGLLVITTVQTGKGECNPALLSQLMDAVLREVRS